MGLRERLRARVGRAGKRVLESIIGEGNVRGTGESHSARTSAWPPARMGSEASSEPPPHPADLAEAGAFVEAAADWSMPMHIEEAVAEAADAARSPGQTAEPSAPAPAPKAMTTPAGSVAQQEWLPMPKAPAPRAEPQAQAQSQPEPTPQEPARPVAEGEVISLSPAEREAVEDEIVATLKTVYDPEIPVDIYELGLIYGVDVAEDGTAEIRMTLTSPNCPAAQSMPAEVETKTKRIAGIRDAMVDIVWDPPWGPDKMSEAARIELNIDF